MVTDVRKLADESDVNASCCEWSTFGSPSKTILQDPRVKVGFGLVGQAQAGISNALKDVVIVLGGPEHGRAWIWNIPSREAVSTTSSGANNKTRTMRHRRRVQ